MKCKVFTDRFKLDLEKEINYWLSQNKDIDIKYVTQSETDFKAFLTIFYEEIDIYRNK